MSTTRYETSLNAATATGAGTAFSMSGKTMLSWQYKPGGTVAATGVSVSLQGKCHPDADFVLIGDAQTDVNGALVVGGFPTSLCEVRLYLTTLTGGTAPTITGWICMS